MHISLNSTDDDVFLFFFFENGGEGEGAGRLITTIRIEIIMPIDKYLPPSSTHHTFLESKVEIRMEILL